LLSARRFPFFKELLPEPDPCDPAAVCLQSFLFLDSVEAGKVDLAENADEKAEYAFEIISSSEYIREK